MKNRHRHSFTTNGKLIIIYYHFPISPLLVTADAVVVVVVVALPLLLLLMETMPGVPDLLQRLPFSKTGKDISFIK